MAASAVNEIIPAEGATTETVTGGAKPLHRFLRGEPKSAGVVMMFMGLCLFMFGIPLKKDAVQTSSYIYCSFWLGILYFTCGVLYVLAERQTTKKTVTASLVLSIISTLGTVVAIIAFSKEMAVIHHTFDYHAFNIDSEDSNYTEAKKFLEQHYMSLYSLEAVMLSHSLVGGAILIIMTVFARLALRSTRTQTVVIMRNLPAAE